jgi:uncharacterized protein YbjT (DUF2867 family)
MNVTMNSPSSSLLPVPLLPSLSKQVETEEERKAEIPIVQLNPGGILNWKYRGEAALRASGLPYTIFRACGLVPDRAFNKTSMYAH